MTSDDTNTATNPVATAGRRFSTGVVLVAGVVGLLLGAIAAFAVTGLVWTVRVELPPPPYPQLSAAPTPGCLSPPPPAPAAPSSSAISLPPAPPLPHA
jgi:hypothetical protein